MTQPFDISKLRTDLTKNIPGIGVGTHDPTAWVSLGNYAINWLITGDFDKGLPLGKVMTLAGEPGSGKSYFAINAVRDALAQGMYVILMDSEQALDATWLSRLGIDPDHERLVKLDVAEINHVANVIADFFETYRKNYLDVPSPERPKFLVVIDSLGMLLSPTDVAQFEDADMKGDKGLRAKMLYSLIRNSVAKFGSYDIGMLATNHVYQSQDQYDPSPKISGGSGFIFASSIVLTTQKLKLREDEDGKVTMNIHGIRAKVTQKKSRFNHKALEKQVEVFIRTDSGMDPYSGLYELFLELGIFRREGKEVKVTYIDHNGEVLRWYKKDITPEIYERILEDQRQIKDDADRIDVRGMLDANEQQRDEDDIGHVGTH